MLNESLLRLHGLHAELGLTIASGHFTQAVPQSQAVIGILEGLITRQRDLSLQGHANLIKLQSLLRGVHKEDAARTTHALLGAYLAESGYDTFSPAMARKLDFAIDGGIRPSVDPSSRNSWGRRIFNEAKKLPRSPLRYYQDLLFKEMLSDAKLKEKMIAFLDVATSVPPEKLGRYFRQYFPPKKTKASGILKMALGLGRLGVLTDEALGSAVTGRAIKRSLNMMGRRFLAGENIKEALKTSERLRRNGRYVTLDVVQEHVVSQKEAGKYHKHVLELIDAWAAVDIPKPLTAGGVPVRHVSLKLSGLTNRFEPVAHDQVIREVGGRLLDVCKRAKAHKAQGKPVMVNVDLEEMQVRDLSYQVLWNVLTDPALNGWDDMAVVVQAYHKDAEEVMMQLIDLAKKTGKKIQIRIVKGAYHKYEQIISERNGWQIPVCLTQEETDRNFERMVRLALANHQHIRTAVGSHNIYDVGLTQDIREQMGLPITAVEHQFLMGVGDAPARATAKLGIPTRMYGPFGPSGDAIGYEVRRLDEVTPDSAIGKTHIAGSWEEYLEERERRHKDSAERLSRSRESKKEPPFANEPEPNFAKGEVREAMRKAIEDRKGRGAVQVTSLIGKETINFDSSRAKKAVNPAKLDHVLGHVMQGNEQDVDKALENAEQGFKSWSGKRQSERSNILNKAADLASQRKFEIAADIVLEAGKNWEAAIADVNEGIDFLRAYAIDGLRDFQYRDPLGIGVAIAPFNYPFAIAMGEVAGGLALGNAMILKPSDMTPIIGRHVVQVLRDAGVPEEAVQLLPGRGSVVGQKLVESPQVDFIAFTGSKETADKIMETAAEHPSVRHGVKIVVAETGGKNPMIVDESADLDVAVEAILAGAFGMAGQRCSATSRVIVLESVADLLTERLIEGARSMLVGDPEKPETQVGPVIGAAAYETILRYIRDGLREGRLATPETSVAGMTKDTTDAEIEDIARNPPKNGWFIDPHLFVGKGEKEGLDRKAKIVLEEIFGPVLSILRAKDFDQAMEIANETAYGLTAGLISRDPQHIEQFFREIQAGDAYVNRKQIGARVWETPFGGAKLSGTGPKAGGHYYVSRFSRPRAAPYRQAGQPSFATPLFGARALYRWPDSSDSLYRQMTEAQTQWVTVSASERAKILRKVRGTLSENLITQPDRIRHDLERARDWMRSYEEAAPGFLKSAPTIYRPGEINEEAHDWPLGIGLIWGSGETLTDMIAATAAAIAMGNAVILPDTDAGRYIALLFKEEGIPNHLITVCAGNPNALLQSPGLAFVVAHGARAAFVNRSLFSLSPGHRDRKSFPRFIGIHDEPDDPHYLTRFANSRVRIERTLRHATDLGSLRGV